MTIDDATKDPGPRQAHPLRGLLVSQTFGTFNDNAWKQVVILLGIAAVRGERAAQEQAAWPQVILMIPLLLVSLPAGLLADRMSKRTVIVGMKVLELVLMLAGSLALYLSPAGGWPALAVLCLLGVQAAIFSPAKYGILPEVLPHERLSAGNGLLEMCTNLAIIAGIVGGGVIVSLSKGQPWVGGLILSGLAAAGLLASLGVPHVKPARSEGGLGETIKLAWSAIRSDRILSLAIRGQIFVWTVASLVPSPVLAYATKGLKLSEGMTGLPLAALGVGIGLGCFAAGKLSAAKVEYGLLPLGAIGLTLSTAAFAILAPGFAGTLVLMGLMGVSSGLLFVPLNALIQWRSPVDRRGAVIAMANVLVYAGMLAGSLLALGLARAGVSPLGTFGGASIVLAAGSAWALWLVPDAFLRFGLVFLANTLYRLRVIGGSNVPAEGGALLTPNHVSFVDGLFVIAAIDRPVRFVVYADYFRRPILGRFLRAMNAIPISGSGGPRMILQAFREAGKALDNGELVCIFPEGQITRTGMLQPFQRGLERIVKGRTVPIIPVHIDRATGSIFSPLSRSWLPERIPYPITLSFGAPLPATTPLPAIRQAIDALNREAWTFRREDRRPLHHELIRRARRHPFRLALADVTRPKVSYLGAAAGMIAMARALRPRWGDQASVGILLPTGVGGVLVNLAASLSGRTAVNLNFTAGRAAMESAARQAGLKTVVTSRAFLEKAKLELPGGVEAIWVEEARDAITRKDRATSMLLACLAPKRAIERASGAARRPTIDDVAAIIFSSGSTGEPKGVMLTHFNIDSNVEALGSVFRTRPDDRLMDILPLFHSFGYLEMWLAFGRGLGLICHANPLEAAAVGDLTQRYAATIMLATPTFLQIYMRRVAPAQFGSLRIVGVGAEKLPESLARAFEDTFGVRLFEGYGTTETSPVVAVNTLDYRAPNFFQPGSRRGFVGHPLPGVSVRIVDPEAPDPAQAADRPANEEGMILVKGPNIMKGYLGRDDLTARAVHDGWYITGDIGLLDGDGFLKVTGRQSRFSKIGGEMVPHGRVEEALQEALGTPEPAFAVTAVDDGKGGERLAVLYTVSDEQATKALNGLKDAGLPNLFIPRRDQLVKVDALPMLGTGKLDLRAVKKVAQEKLAVANAAEPAPATA